MGWNDPGGNNKDPWSSGNRQGPPDLDELIRKLKQRAARFLGGRGGNSGGDGKDNSGGGGGGFGATGILLLLVIVVLGWLASGIYIIDEGTRGVVTRFGEYSATTMPGPHWHLPTPIEGVERVDVESRRRITIGYEAVSPSNTRAVPSEALMLTEDENIANVQLAVQYQVAKPAQFLFNFASPEQTLKSVTESALREVVGKRQLDFVLTEGRAEVAQRTRELVQGILDSYNMGISLAEVVVQDIQPPEPVQPAFLDAIKAREDKQRSINQAQAYRNQILPRARGQAARIKQQAEGYRQRVIADAKGDADRFTQLLTEYEKAPAVTRERLYLESMQSVLSQSGKVLIDLKAKDQPLLYLPLERLLRQGKQGKAEPSDDSRENTSGSQQSGPHMSSSGGNSSESGRSRESR